MIEVKILGTMDRGTYTKLPRGEKKYINPQHIAFIWDKKPGGSFVELINKTVIHIAGEPDKLLSEMGVKPKTTATKK